MEAAQESDLGLPLDMLGEIFTLENRVTLPGVIKDNNADDVQGNTLVWEVGISDSRQMQGESVTYDWVHIGLIAFAALVVFVLAHFWIDTRPDPPISAVPQLAVSGDRGTAKLQGIQGTKRSGDGQPAADAPVTPKQPDDASAPRDTVPATQDPTSAETAAPPSTKYRSTRWANS